jgi:predicted SprT family Zn-dependent metalloprotease
MVLSIGNTDIVSRIPPSACSSDSPSIIELQEMYKNNNKKYFSSKLPNKVIIRYGGSDEYTGFTSYENGVFIIEINPKHNLTPNQTELTLIHEMCHVSSYPEFDDHGRKFMAELHRLMNAGVFDKLL